MARRNKTIWRVAVDQAGIPADTEVKAAAAGQYHCVIAFFGSLDFDGTIQFNSDGAAGTDLSGAVDAAAKVPFSFRADPDYPLFVTDQGESLDILTTGGAFAGVVVGYTEGA